MLKKLFRARFGKSAESGRRLESVADLRIGDLLTFKHRLALPPSVQGQTFEVAKVGGYEYEDGLYPQLALDGAEAGRIYLTFKANDATELSLCRDLPRKDVVKLFGEDEFAKLWEDDFAELAVTQQVDGYDGWLAERYSQTKKWAEGYFHEKDMRGEQLSAHQDDDSEELRCHECEDASGQFGLSVEVWGDGDTEVSLEVHCTPDVIESMWPGDDSGS